MATSCSDEDGEDEDKKGDSSATPSPDASVNGAVDGGIGTPPSDTLDVPNDATTLHGRYINHFAIGAALDQNSYITHRDVITEHFNSITAENEMKFDALQPQEGEFYFNTADRMVEFAERYNMFVRGHALVWHRQTPDWVFEDENGADVSQSVLFERMQTHIYTVMDHFKGKVSVWDVVNEVIMEDGSLRTGNESREGSSSRWHAIAGESYIAEAFRYAHEADPDAKLFYNDFYNYVPERYEGTYNLLKGLIDAGVPIHGVGLQCHLHLAASSDPGHHSFHQTGEYMEKAIELYASLGLDIHITELDISLYLPWVGYDEESYYTEETFTADLEQQQAERYAEFFAVFRKHKDVISNVTLWGVADDNTWRSERNPGQLDFPLLFDTNHEPKLAFDAVFNY